MITATSFPAPDAKEGDIGSVTLRAYENETNVLIWQYTFFSSVDGTPPTVEAIPPPTLTFTGDLLFNATVKDASGIGGVMLWYSVNYGGWNHQTMQWNSGDTFKSTSYMLTIPHLPDNSIVRYYLVATDWLGNQGISDTQTVAVSYDLAVTEVKTSSTIVGQGYKTRVDATIANEGTISYTSVRVSFYANATLIHTQTIPYLAEGTTATITFYWNNTGFAKGNYRISAYVWPLLGEIDIADNTFPDGTILIVIPGDINGDQWVNAKDAVVLGMAFYPFGTYSSNADINGDYFVNAKDAVILGMHFNEHW